MVFPILRLPHLALEEVLLNFLPIDLFDFSLCSYRCRQSVKSIRHPYIGLNISIMNDRVLFTLQKVYAYNILFSQGAASWVLLKKARDTRAISRGVNRKVDGVVFRAAKDNNTLTTRNKKNLLLKVYHYLQDIFKNLPITSFYFGTDNDRELLPSYFGIQKCQELNFYPKGNLIPNETIRDIIKNLEVSKSLHLCLLQNLDFRMDNARFKTDQIEIQNSQWITRETFFTMDCTRITLKGSSLTPRDFVEFIANWYRSENRRLVWLKIRMVNNREWLDLSSLPARPWDQKLRAQWFGLYNLNTWGPWKLDCSKGMDITRSDGLMATIIQKQACFFFVVWHERFPNCDRLSVERFASEF